MPDFPSFEEFYEAVNERPPFPWQRDLAEEVVAGGWPGEIGIGTGLGKTSCIDIALWTMAAEGTLPPSERRTATRVWYVVSRRLLVDAAYEHGRELEGMLREPDAAKDSGVRSVLSVVADGLKARRGGAGGAPVEVTRLRGGAELGARPVDLSQPALIFATVPMFASRWLFRGYGVSFSMRPVDAALAGTDSVVLLDEAHLSRHLVALAGPLAQCDVGDPSAVLSSNRARSRIVSLTATGEGGGFTLGDEDMRHPVVRKRLDACKPARLVEAPQGKLPVTLSENVRELLGSRRPSAAVVFVNSPRTARAVFEDLRKAVASRSAALDADLVLLTGRMREREANAVRSRLLDRVRGAPAGRDPDVVRSRHLIVVATQSLEVGADLDFDVLVTELCGARALVQRFGRLNRLGEVDAAAGVIVREESRATFGIYGEEPLAVWERLVERGSDGLNLAPSRITEMVGPPGDDTGRAGEILPAHLWEWAKTTTPPPGEALPELFYDAIQDVDFSVSVIWRAHVAADDVELRPAPSADEAVEVPITEAREELAKVGDGTVRRVKPGSLRLEPVSARELRPGDIVVLPADAGQYDEHGWAPGSSGTIFDMSLLRAPGIPLTTTAMSQLVADGPELVKIEAVARFLAQEPESDEGEEAGLESLARKLAEVTDESLSDVRGWSADRDSLKRRLVDLLGEAVHSSMVSDDEWSDLLSRLSSEVSYVPGEPGRLEVRRTSGGRVVADVRMDAFDELSLDAKSTSLEDHLEAVGRLASEVAKALGLPASLVEAVGAAGRFHDLGKVDARFQRWLDPEGAGGGLMAKSDAPPWRWERMRAAAGWPRGGRHEELSRRLVSAHIDASSPPWDRDLVEHLVVSHHGRGRPLVERVRDDSPALVAADVEGERHIVSGDLGFVDWEQAARFRRCCERYGYWGLAVLEAILRQADHVVSSVVVS